MPRSLKELFTFEDDEPVITESIRLSPDSVDAQIDSVLLGYQGDALAQEGVMPHHFSLLLEQPPDEEEPNPEDEFGDEELGDEELGDEPEEDPNAEPVSDQTVGDDEIESNERAEPRVTKINIDEFAQKVVNLLENHEHMLDLETVIINRSKKILTQQGYDQNTVNEFEETLDRDFRVSLDSEPEVPEAPPGGNAGPLS